MSVCVQSLVDVILSPCSCLSVLYPSPARWLYVPCDFFNIKKNPKSTEAFERVPEATNEGLAAVMADYQAICTGLVGDAMERSVACRNVLCKRVRDERIG